MKCANCGTEFNEGLFCPECGEKYDEEKANAAELRRIEYERKRQEQEIETQKRQRALELEREENLKEKINGENCLVSKIIRSSVICYIYIQILLLFCALGLVVIDEIKNDSGNYGFILIAIVVLPILLSVIKLLFCVLSFLPIWNKFEKERLFFIRERNIFTQLLFRLGFQLAFTIFWIMGSFVILLLVGLLTGQIY